MARIGIANIDKVELNVFNIEREYDSQDIDPRISAMYISKGYHNAPKTRQEAGSQGNFNGLMSSFPVIQVYSEPGKTSVYAFIAPTRYLIGQAMRDLVQKRKEEGKPLSQKEISDTSPNMANVSLIVPVKKEGNYFILSQIKGKVLGSGEIHTGLAAGNVDAECLKHPNPLTAALTETCTRKIGIDFGAINPTGFTFLVDESDLGMVNFACTARNADIEKILATYEASAKLQNPLEVIGLALVPIPATTADGILKGVVCYHPTPNGLETKIEDRKVRPYTQAVLDYISNPENVKFLLEKAGF